MTSAIISRICAGDLLLPFHHCHPLVINMTVMGRFMSGVLHRMSGGGFLSSTAMTDVLSLPAMPINKPLSISSSMKPCFISIVIDQFEAIVSLRREAQRFVHWYFYLEHTVCFHAQDT